MGNLNKNLQNELIINIDNEEYKFKYVQDLIPVCQNGELRVYNHLNSAYNNYEKNEYGGNDFCDFWIEYPKNISGVYIWVINKDKYKDKDNFDDKYEIIYIGEAKDLLTRFNTNYGHISPYNCTKNGQRTNCKMNNVVLELYRKHNKIVHLYFLPCKNHKKVETILLANINTKYNAKNNKKCTT